MPSTPYMKLYIGDYLGDTQHLSALEHGVYILLIMAYWQNGGPLENDPKVLRRITRTTPREFQKASKNVLKMFQVKDSMLVHKRVDSELAKKEQVSMAARNAINSRWYGRNTDELRTNYERNTTPIVHSPDIREEKNTHTAREGEKTTPPVETAMPKAVFDEWTKLGDRVYQPGDYATVFASKWGELRRHVQGIHSDDVFAAIRNFGKILAGPPGKYYWNQRVTIEAFLSKHLDKFTPVNFQEEDFLARDGPRQRTGPIVTPEMRMRAKEAKKILGIGVIP